MRKKLTRLLGTQNAKPFPYFDVDCLDMPANKDYAHCRTYNGLLGKGVFPQGWAILHGKGNPVKKKYTSISFIIQRVTFPQINQTHIFESFKAFCIFNCIEQAATSVTFESRFSQGVEKQRVKSERQQRCSQWVGCHSC